MATPLSSRNSATAQTGTGAGNPVDLGAVMGNVTMVVSGTSTSYTVNGEGSVDGATWVPAVINGSAQTTTPTAGFATGKAFRYWRSNVIAIANGNVTTDFVGNI